MAFIDDRGRLFGRVNVIDLGLVLAGAAVAGLFLIGFLTARRPPVPVIAVVTPPEQVTGTDLRVRLTGDNLLPYLKAFIQRSDQAAFVGSPDAPGDGYKMANAAVVTFLVETQRLAEVRLPESLAPGVYDLILYNDTEQVAVVREAFRILPVPSEPDLPTATRVTMTVVGAFARLSPNGVPRLAAGSRLTTADGKLSAAVMASAPSRPDVLLVTTGHTRTEAVLDGLVRVPATLRAQCELIGENCFIAGVKLEPAARFPLELDGRKLEFVVEEFKAGLERRSTVRAQVRFAVRQEFAPSVKVGDVSQPTPLAGAARLIEIIDRRELTSQNVMTLSDLQFQSFSVPDRVVVIDAVVEVPVIAGDYGWTYRDEPVRVGASLNFETPTYLMRGWILGVTIPGDTKR